MNVPRNVVLFEVLLYLSLTLDALSVAFQDRSPNAERPQPMIGMAPGVADSLCRGVGDVGGAPGKVNLYGGKPAVKFNIPVAESVDRLQDLIREHGKWVDPVADPENAVAG